MTDDSRDADTDETQAGSGDGGLCVPGQRHRRSMRSQRPLTTTSLRSPAPGWKSQIGRCRERLWRVQCCSVQRRVLLQCVRLDAAMHAAAVHVWKALRLAEALCLDCTHRVEREGAVGAPAAELRHRRADEQQGVRR